MNAKFAYPMALAALLAFGASTLGPVFAQEAEQQTQQEQEQAPQPQSEGGSSESGN